MKSLALSCLQFLLNCSSLKWISSLVSSLRCWEEWSIDRQKTDETSEGPQNLTLFQTRALFWSIKSSFTWIVMQKRFVTNPVHMTWISTRRFSVIKHKRAQTSARRLLFTNFMPLHNREVDASGSLKNEDWRKFIKSSLSTRTKKFLQHLMALARLSMQDVGHMLKFYSSSFAVSISNEGFKAPLLVNVLWGLYGSKEDASWLCINCSSAGRRKRFRCIS